MMTAILAIAAAGVKAQGIQVQVDGDPVRFSGIGPREMSGRVMVPLRGVLEKLGAYVDYDAGNRTVIATKGDTNIELGIGQRFATVDGNRVDLDAPATIVAGNTMVPLRFISEALGSRVSWNPYSSTVAINTGAATDVAVARPYRSARAHRTPVSVTPVVYSVRTNVADNFIDPGDVVRVTMRATPGGTGYFRIRGLVGEVKMTEVEPGLYQGKYRALNITDPRPVDDQDILAFVVVGDKATSEMSP